MELFYYPKWIKMDNKKVPKKQKFFNKIFSNDISFDNLTNVKNSSNHTSKNSQMDNKKFQKFQNIMTKLIKTELFLLKIHRQPVLNT